MPPLPLGQPGADGAAPGQGLCSGHGQHSLLSPGFLGDGLHVLGRHELPGTLPKGRALERVTCTPNPSLAPCFEDYAPQTTTESPPRLLPAPVPSSSALFAQAAAGRWCQCTNTGTPSVPALPHTKGSCAVAGPGTGAACQGGREPHRPQRNVTKIQSSQDFGCHSSASTAATPQNLQNQEFRTSLPRYFLHNILLFFFSLLCALR